jgi:uncharacterized integral membrane protein
VTTPDPHPAASSRDPMSTGPATGAPGARAADPAPVAEPAPRPTPERHTGRAIGRTLALALLIAVTVLLVLFVVFNTQTVDVSLVFVDVEAPLVVALLVAAALGGLLVWLAGLVFRARRRNR